MCWAAKTDEMVTDGNPMVIGQPRERERERDAREKSEMPRLRGIRRTNRCNYGSPGTDVGYVDPSSSLVRLRPPVRGKRTRTTVFERDPRLEIFLSPRDTAFVLTNSNRGEGEGEGEGERVAEVI